MTDPGRTAVIDRPILRKLVIPVALGFAAFTVVIIARGVGLLSGWAVVVVAVVATLAIPSSRETSRRLLIAGCVALGWLPMTWWFPLPLGAPDRLSLLTSLIIGALTALIAAGRVRAAALIPRFRVSDAWTVAAGAYALWMLAPLFSVADGEEALRILRIGWDYASHFDMTESIRRTGSISEAIQPGPHGAWMFSDYPRGFHAAAATVMEVIAGPAIGAHGTELVAFTHAVALLGLITVVTVASGVSALPQLRRRPIVALALVALVAVAFTTGPGGGSLLRYGFPNFLLAVGLLACVPLLVIPMNRIGAVAPLIALSGVIVGIAHNWALLLAIAGAGLVSVLLPMGRRRWPTSGRGWSALAGIATATVVGALAAWITLVEKSVETATVSRFLVDGGFVGGDGIEILVPPLIAVGLCLLLGWLLIRRRAGWHRGEAVRAATQGLMPTAGLILMGWMAALHYTETGGLRYYFYKLGAGVQLASVVLAAAAIAVLVSLLRATPRRPSSAAHRSVERRMAVAATTIAFVVASVVSSGFVNPTSDGPPVRRPPGYDARSAWQRELAAPTPHAVDAAREVLLAAEAATSDDRQFFVPASLDGTTAPRLSNQWLFALTGQWSLSSYETVDGLWGDETPVVARPGDPKVAIERIRQAAPDGTIVVPPALAERIASDERFTDSRIVTW